MRLYNIFEIMAIHYIYGKNNVPENRIDSYIKSELKENNYRQFGKQK